MSLILDALKRAERERQGEAFPSPRQVPAALVQPGPLAGRGRDVAGTLVIVAGLGLAAALLWDAFRTKPAPAPAAPPPQAQAPVSPAAQPEVIKARPAPPEAPAVVPGTESVASLDDLTDEDAILAPAASTPLPARTVPAPKPVKPSSTSIATKPAPPPTASQPTEFSATPAPPTVVAKQPPAPAPTPEPKVAPQPVPPAAQPPAAQAPVQPAPAPAPAEVPPALTQPAPLRKFREMPPDYRADFPPLRVEIHVYEKEPQRRFVMVNGRRYKEGERMAEGPSLLEIVPEGLVLEYRGEKLLYTLGR